MKTTGWRLAIAALAMICVADVGAAGEIIVRPSHYRGWKTLEMSNRLVQLQVAPQIGGRVIQFALGNYEYFFVNPELSGKEPPPSGLGSAGEWLNYGGEKLWPAPQGWDNAQQWPGPPDAVLDGSPHEGQIKSAADGRRVIRLQSPKDPRTGIQFSRTLEIHEGSTCVNFAAEMLNIDTKPRRWGIWSVVQQDAADRSGPGYDKNLRVFCPMNPESLWPKGYEIMFGLAGNPAFQPDPARGLMQVHYQHRVGKVGLDSASGWLATVHGSTGRVFVQRFQYFPAKKYPDNASVEIWLHGPGEYVAAGKIEKLEDDPRKCPCLIETELLSPLATLKPGERFTFAYAWAAAALGGDFPVIDCTDAGVVSQPLSVRRKADGTMTLSGRFGVFYQGSVAIRFYGDKDLPIAAGARDLPVDPGRPLVLSESMLPFQPPAEARTLRLLLRGREGSLVGELARATLSK
jgi:hypothetical protein